MTFFSFSYYIPSNLWRANLSNRNVMSVAALVSLYPNAQHTRVPLDVYIFVIA